jgi:four helix bundle protein
VNAERGNRNAELKQRTFEFGLRGVRLVESLPKNNATAQVIGRQLLRAGTAVGANYRAAKRARSRAEFVAKLGVVEEECDETQYWIELLVALDLAKRNRVAELQAEADELLAIVVSSIKTARSARQK